jgi:hypothetical protein
MVWPPGPSDARVLSQFFLRPLSASYFLFPARLFFGVFGEQGLEFPEVGFCFLGQVQKKAFKLLVGWRAGQLLIEAYCIHLDDDGGPQNLLVAEWVFFLKCSSPDNGRTPRRSRQG